MLAPLHHDQDAPELHEVLTLPSLERMPHEEWDDTLAQMLELSYAVRHSVAVVATNDATTKVRLQRVQRFHIAFVLDDSEFRQNLITGRHLGVSCDTHVKTAFTVHEARDPSCIQLHRSTLNIKS